MNLKVLSRKISVTFSACVLSSYATSSQFLCASTRGNHLFLFEPCYTTYIPKNVPPPSNWTYDPPHVPSFHSPSAVRRISISQSSETFLSSIPPPSTGNNSPNRTISSAGHISV